MLQKLGQLWDWIDKRDIDKHVLTMGIFWGTVKLTSWAMAFTSQHPDKPGIELAAIIAAVTAPYMALQAAAIKFYFESRPTK
jgi:hypothetical protein